MQQHCINTMKLFFILYILCITYVKIGVIFCNDKLGLWFVLTVHHVHVESSLLWKHGSPSQSVGHEKTENFSPFNLNKLTCLMKSSGRCSWSSTHFSSSPTKKLTKEKKKRSHWRIYNRTVQSPEWITWLTPCASRRSGECSQRRFYPFLSCRRERPSPRSSSWSPARSQNVTVWLRKTHVQYLGRTECRADEGWGGWHGTDGCGAVSVSPPPPGPGLWHSPSPSESAHSEQTCAGEREH